MNGEHDHKPDKQTGFIFKPALQDISLKRFRMRYSVIDDCYYLHWDDAACAPLAKIEGLNNGTNSLNGVSRFCDESSDQMFVGKKDLSAKRSEVTWRFDFSDCGLVVKQFRVKGRCSDDDDIDWRVIGDERVGCRPMLAATDDYIDIPEVYGCRVVTVTAVAFQGSGNEAMQILKSDEEAMHGECPLDIKVDLMCPRSEEENYVGEILVGIKWSSSTDAAETTTDVPSNGPSNGQLQVYIVEGAGMVDEDTHKPFNAFIKCNLLPEGKKEHTSPRQTAFPSWSKQFHFQHIERDDMVYGGLEVLLCDSHLLYNSNIAGIRLCVPQKHERKSCELKPLGSPILQSPVISRSASPSSHSDPSDDGHSHPLSNSRHSSPSPTLLHHSSPSPTLLHISSPSQKSKFHNMFEQCPVEPPAFRRSLTPTPQSSSYHSQGLSPPVLRRSHSPMSIAKSLFRLSGSHIRDHSSVSPLSSPILGGRKKSPLSSPILGGRKKMKNHHRGEGGEFMFPWMNDVKRTERNHWQQMLSLEGEWVYCWHIFRPNLKPVHS